MKVFNVNAHLTEALAAADEHDLPPELTKDWEPVECLGRSRMSETLLVRSKQDGAHAVVKLIAAEQTEPQLADILPELNHPGLPKVQRVWKDEKQYCFLREYVEGESAAEPGREWTEREIIEIGVKLCDILQYLHGHTPPVIHRDVKPENIILRPDGTPVLIDFGIARLFSPSAGADTKVMGTERFAPPEQYGFQQTDARSDIYSLGMTLCYLLTGETGNDAPKSIKNKRLRRVIGKCMAFAPGARYASAAQLKQALQGCLGSKRGGIAVLGSVCAAVIAAFLLWPRGPAPVTFIEPLIEQDVRQMLGVTADERLTAEQLEQVTGLYIFGDTICLDQDGFYAAASAWYQSGTRSHGSIASLEDVRLLPQLHQVMIAAQQITDLTPLEALSNLEKLELKHNYVTDITVLSGLEKLTSVGLNDNAAGDMTPLLSLPGLRFLDLCDANGYDPAVIEKLGDMEFLDISNRTESWRHLGTRRIKQLKLGWTGLESLSALAGVTGLEHLEIEHTKITSLEGIEVHTGLISLRISGNALTDLSPLLALPALSEVTLSRDMEPLVEVLGEVNFSVKYE